MAEVIMSFGRFFAVVLSLNAARTVLAHDDKHDHEDFLSSKATFAIGAIVGSLIVCYLVCCCLWFLKNSMVLPAIPFKSGSEVDNNNSSQNATQLQQLPSPQV